MCWEQLTALSEGPPSQCHLARLPAAAARCGKSALACTSSHPLLPPVPPLLPACLALQSQLRQCFVAGLVTGLWAVFWDIEWRWPAPPARDDRFWIFFRVGAAPVAAHLHTCGKLRCEASAACRLPFAVWIAAAGRVMQAVHAAHPCNACVALHAAFHSQLVLRAMLCPCLHAVAYGLNTCPVALSSPAAAAVRYAVPGHAACVAHAELPGRHQAEAAQPPAAHDGHLQAGAGVAFRLGAAVAFWLGAAVAFCGAHDGHLQAGAGVWHFGWVQL